MKKNEGINWDAAKEFVGNIFPSLRKEVVAELTFLRELSPVFCLEEYPPSIDIMLYAIGSESTLENKECQERVERIACVIGEVASRHNLRADLGRIRTSHSVVNLYGYYTLKPDYEQFRFSREEP